MCGCSDNNTQIYKCSYSHNEDNYNYISVVEYDVSDNLVVDATVTMTYDDESSAKNMYEILLITDDGNDNVKLDNNQIIIYNYQESLNLDSLDVEEFESYLQSIKFKCD